MMQYSRVYLNGLPKPPEKKKETWCEIIKDLFSVLFFYLVSLFH